MVVEIFKLVADVVAEVNKAIERNKEETEGQGPDDAGPKALPLDDIHWFCVQAVSSLSCIARKERIADVTFISGILVSSTRSESGLHRYRANDAEYSTTKSAMLASETSKLARTYAETPSRLRGQSQVAQRGATFSRHSSGERERQEAGRNLGRSSHSSPQRHFRAESSGKRGIHDT